MGRLATKLLVLAGSSVVAGGGVWWIWSARAKPRDIGFADNQLGRVPDDAARTTPPRDDAVAPSTARGIPALDARRPIFPPSSFERWYLTPEEAGRLLGQRDVRVEYDPYCYFRYKPDVDHEFEWEEHPRGKWRLITNGLGLREEHEVLATQPDLRILVAGDSHTDGVCDNAESFPNVLEASLQRARPGQSIEALNAGKACYTFFNYLGTLERFLALQPDVFVVAVFGGNDFEEGLSLHHLFRGTPRPGGRQTYAKEFDRAAAIHAPCVAQSLNQVMYLARDPEQIEFALQSARDVTTEIQVTCERFGVHPIVVYIPAPFSGDPGWEEHDPPIDEVLGALGLTREAMRINDRLADSYLAFVRERRIDCIDMRPIYRAGTERMYWLRDHHTNIAGQRAIAEALLPVIEAARPVGAQRVRPAPGARAATDAEALALRQAAMSPGAPDLAGPTITLHELPNEPMESTWKLALAPSFELPRPDANAVERLVTLDSLREYDAATWWRYKPKLGAPLTTNSLGLRGAREPAAEHPRLRVLCVGDEQFGAACAFEESGSARLETLLRARHLDTSFEVLDASCRGYGLHNALGVLERFDALAPDVLVVGVSGGTDFDAALRTERALRPRAGDPPTPELAPAALEALALDPAASEQFLAPLARFRERAEDTHEAVRVAVDITNELRRRCEKKGIQLVIVYVPPAHEVEWERFASKLGPLVERLGFSDKDLKATTRIATNYLSHVRQLQVEVIDMTPLLRQLAGPHFVEAEYLLGPSAQRTLAEFVRLSIEHRQRLK